MRFGLVEKLVEETKSAIKKGQALFIKWDEDRDLKQIQEEQKQFGRKQVAQAATDNVARRHRRLLYRELVTMIAKHRSDKWTDICDEIEDYIGCRPIDWNGDNLILTKDYSTMSVKQINQIRETFLRNKRNGSIYRRTLKMDPDTKEWHWID